LLRGFAELMPELLRFSSDASDATTVEHAGWRSERTKKRGRKREAPTQRDDADGDDDDDDADDADDEMVCAAMPNSGAGGGSDEDDEALQQAVSAMVTNPPATESPTVAPSWGVNFAAWASWGEDA
jgi:hypothetical protein